VVLKPSIREHVLEALFRDDWFPVMMMRALVSLMTLSPFLVRVVAMAAYSVELEARHVLCGATAFDGTQQWKRVVVLRSWLRVVVLAVFGALRPLGMRAMFGDLVVLCALSRSSLLAVFLLGHESSFG
jgi:hypothetical protein